MIKSILFALFGLVFFAACNSTAPENKTTEEETAATTESTAEVDTTKFFGAVITEEDAVPVADLFQKLTTIEETDSVSTKVVGTVESVCQMKGCWMNIVSADNPDQAVFVKFKDYGFFMPLDIAGRRVIMEGYGFRELTSVDELRHYAEDEGKSAEEIAAITEPAEEYKFLASGVILLDD